MRARIRWLFARTRAVWQRAKSERASPRQVGWAVGVGVFAGCTPLVGFHGWVAIGLATVMRLSRLWAWIGSRISSILVLPWIVFAEIESAHWLRTGTLVPLSVKDALREGPALLLDWCVGMVLIGPPLGLLLGFVAYLYARRRAKAGLAGASARSRPGQAAVRERP